MEAVITKPADVSGYELHRAVAAIATGRYVYQDRGDTVVVRAPDVQPDVRVFSLKASVCSKNGGKRSYFHTSDWRSRRAWLERQGAQHGFEIVSVHITARQETVGKARPFTVDATRFVGVLRVTDVAKFEAAKTAGIGGARALGFGFLDA